MPGSDLSPESIRDRSYTYVVNVIKAAKRARGSQLLTDRMIETIYGAPYDSLKNLESSLPPHCSTERIIRAVSVPGVYPTEYPALLETLDNLEAHPDEVKRRVDKFLQNSTLPTDVIQARALEQSRSVMKGLLEFARESAISDTEIAGRIDTSQMAVWRALHRTDGGGRLSMQLGLGQALDVEPELLFGLPELMRLELPVDAVLKTARVADFSRLSIGRIRHLTRLGVLSPGSERQTEQMFGGGDPSATYGSFLFRDLANMDEIPRRKICAAAILSVRACGLEVDREVVTQAKKYLARAFPVANLDAGTRCRVHRGGVAAGSESVPESDSKSDLVVSRPAVNDSSALEPSLSTPAVEFVVTQPESVAKTEPKIGTRRSAKPDLPQQLKPGRSSTGAAVPIEFDHPLTEAAVRYILSLIDLARTARQAAKVPITRIEELFGSYSQFGELEIRSPHDRLMQTVLRGFAPAGVAPEDYPNLHDALLLLAADPERVRAQTKALAERSGFVKKDIEESAAAFSQSVADSLLQLAKESGNSFYRLGPPLSLQPPSVRAFFYRTAYGSQTMAKSLRIGMAMGVIPHLLTKLPAVMERELVVPSIVQPSMAHGKHQADLIYHLARLSLLSPENLKGTEDILRDVESPVGPIADLWTAGRFSKKLTKRDFVQGCAAGLLIVDASGGSVDRPRLADAVHYLGTRTSMDSYGEHDSLGSSLRQELSL